MFPFEDQFSAGFSSRPKLPRYECGEVIVRPIMRSVGSSVLTSPFSMAGFFFVVPFKIADGFLDIYFRHEWVASTLHCGVIPTLTPGYFPANVH